MMYLSLCLAVFNEEENIHYSLDSTIDFVDEVVIIDGSSTDETVSIAKSYGKRINIFVEKNPPMFHINKQKAIERAKGKWILQLDADEAVSKELKEEILAIVKKPLLKNDYTAYYIPRKNLFLTRFLTKGGMYPDYTIRLYRRGTAHFPCRNIHENVVVSGKVGYLKNPLLHYADPNFSRYLVRWNSYTSLEAEELRKKLKNKSQSLMFCNYFFWKPLVNFCSLYFRHKGFVDGFSGFVFALFSSIRFWVVYIKFRTQKGERNSK